MSVFRSVHRILLVAVCPAALQAQQPGATPATTPRLDPRASAAIDTVFSPFARSGSPGCAVGVFQNGSVLFSRGYGFANLTNDVPITPATRFTVGSVSKQFTAASIALLVRAGRLSLDDDIRKYVPELPVYSTPITMRHLVHHTSGLRDFWELVDLAGMRFDDGYAVNDMLSLASKQRALNFEPGTQYRYSNTGYLILGIAVQRITGQSLRRFADSAIFAPLGMRETLFLDDHTEVVPGRASAYSPVDGGWRINVWNNDLVGQGGLVTTLADLQRWDENFYDARVGGRSFVDLIQTTEVLKGGGVNQYAFGLEIETYRGKRVVDHTGSSGGYRAALYRFPEQHTSVAMLCNTSTALTTVLSQRVADIVLRDALGPSTATRARTAAPRRAAKSSDTRPADFDAIIGRYTSAELNDVVWEIGENATRRSLQLRRPRNQIIVLSSTSTSHEYTDGAGLTLRFDVPAQGPSGGFTLNGTRVGGIRFTRVASQ